MWHISDSRGPLLAFLLVLHAAKSYTAPSPCTKGFENFKNTTFPLHCPHHHHHGQHHQHHLHQICGTCPEGMQREAVQGPFCGRCVVIYLDCDNGYFQNHMGKCVTCPCLKIHEHEGRRFGTQCRVDINEQVICDSSNEYTAHFSCPFGCSCTENCPPLRSYPPMELVGSQSKQNFYLVAFITVVILLY